MASKGWVHRFKKRVSLHNIKFQGDQASADAEAAERFKVEIKKIIEEGNYLPDQIFNADETALVWKKLQSKTFTTASQKRVYGF